MINKKLLVLPVSMLSSLAVAAERPNVLFVAFDDLNDWVGCLGGNPQVKTPNLDRFFEEMGGMVMNNASSPATVSGPSRSALLTGRFPGNTGVYSNDINLQYAPKAKDLVTLPEYFAENGYYTTNMGKIFHAHPIIGGPKNKKNNGEWAFQHPVATRPDIGTISKERPINGLPNLPDEKPSYHSTAFDWGATKNEEGTKDFQTGVWAAEQLQNNDFEGKPFFMAVGFSNPHLPWYVPQKYFDMYPLEDIIMPETIEDDLADIVTSNGMQAYKPHQTWLRVEKYGDHREAVRAYLAAISYVDACFGELLKSLESSKYADNTIVVLWGDHGWHLGEKQKYGKTYLWREATRVPLIVKVPGVTKSKTKCEGVVNLIDLYPTLIDLCGLPKNPQNDGRSFAELIKSPKKRWDTPTLTTNAYKSHRVYDGRYSYINVGKGKIEELYDYENDPMEWNNLAHDPKYKSVINRLKAYLPKSDTEPGPSNKEMEKALKK